MPQSENLKRVSNKKRLPRARVKRTLDELARAELVHRTGGNGVAYLFKHTLVQETVHATLLKNECKRLHHLVALALEDVNAQNLDEYAAELAAHFAEADDDAKTLEYSTRAGDRANRLFANDEALKHYQQAIDVAARAGATNEQLIHLYKQRGRILEVVGRFNDALASYLELHELATARQDRALELAYLMLRAPLHSAPMATFDAKVAEQLLLDALGTSRELQDEAAEARVLWNLSLLSTHTMRAEDGLMYGELSLALAEKLDLREQKAFTLHDLFIPYLANGQIARAHQVERESRALFRELGNLPMLADNLAMSAQFTMYEGDFDAALKFCLEGEAVSREVGNTFGIAFNRSFSANIYLEQGDLAKAFAEVDDQIQGVRRGTIPFNELWVAAVIGLTYAQFGAYTSSLDIEQVVRSMQTDGIPPILRAGMGALLARMRICHGDLETAAADLARVQDSFSPQGSPDPGVVQFPLARAELALAQHEYSHALKALRMQSDFARRYEYRLLLPENMCLTADAHIGMGDYDAAQSALEEARAVAEQIGARRSLWQVYARLVELERARGNAVEADMYRTLARGVLDYILLHLPDELRAGFLKLPRVRAVLVETES